MPNETAGQAIFSGLGQAVQNYPQVAQAAQQQAYQNAITQLGTMLKVMQAQQQTEESKANLLQIQSQIGLNNARMRKVIVGTVPWDEELTRKAELEVGNKEALIRQSVQLAGSPETRALLGGLGGRGVAIGPGGGFDIGAAPGAGGSRPSAGLFNSQTALAHYTERAGGNVTEGRQAWLDNYVLPLVTVGEIGPKDVAGAKTQALRDTISNMTKRIQMKYVALKNVIPNSPEYDQLQNEIQGLNFELDDMVKGFEGKVAQAYSGGDKKTATDITPEQYQTMKVGGGQFQPGTIITSSDGGQFTVEEWEEIVASGLEP